MHYDWEKIGARITAERDALRLGIGELAIELYVHRNTLSAWEKGDKQHPPLEDLLNMCDIFNCEIPYLLCEMDCKTRTATDIQSKTGLSEKAIQVLMQNYDEKGIMGNVLSQMIEHPEFIKLIIGLAEGKHRLRQKDEIDDDVMAQVSEHITAITRTGFAVLPPEDAAEFWLQQARDSLRDIAKSIDVRREI